MELQLTYRTFEQYKRVCDRFPGLVASSGCRVIVYPNEVLKRYDGKGSFTVVIDTAGVNGKQNLESAVVSAMAEVITKIGVPQRVEADSKGGYMAANHVLRRFNYELRWSWLTGFYISHISQLIPEKFRKPRLAVIQE